MRSSPYFTAAALLCICSLLLPPAVSPQDFSSIAGDLSALENLIRDALKLSLPIVAFSGAPTVPLGSL
jgi:hypothetical protein